LTAGRAVLSRVAEPAYFYNRSTGLRIDLLFDYPLVAATLARTARRMKVQSAVLTVASEKALLRLKKIARRDRAAPGDSEDIAFLQSRAKQR
jgi:hypothetical protein